MFHLHYLTESSQQPWEVDIIFSPFMDEETSLEKLRNFSKVTQLVSKWSSGECNCVCLIRALPTLLRCHIFTMTPISHRGIYRFEWLHV